MLALLPQLREEVTDLMKHVRKRRPGDRRDHECECQHDRCNQRQREALAAQARLHRDIGMPAADDA